MMNPSFETTVPLVSLTVVLVLVAFKNYLRQVWLAFSLKGPPALPFLGNVLLILDDKKLEFLGNNLNTLYGPIPRIWLSFIPTFFITEPADLKIVLTNNRSTKNMFYDLLHNFIGEGLVTSSGPKWRLHRKLMQPYFHTSALQVFFERIEKCCESLLHNLEEGHQQDPVNVTGIANKFVLEVVNGTVLGLPEDSSYRGATVSLPYRVSRPWLLVQWIFRRTSAGKSERDHEATLREHTRTLVSNRGSHGQLVTFLDFLREVSQRNPLDFTNEDIIDEVTTLMLAGQDTVASALVFTLYYLAKYPECQQRAYEDLGRITFEGVVDRMRYLEQCIKETLRLCPSVPMITRRLTQNVKLSGGTVLPVNSNVFISPFVTHRLPHVFPEPQRFDPDRFSVDCGEVHKFGYLPFSVGSRNCIGHKFAMIQLKMALGTIVRDYRLELVEGHEDIRLGYRVTLRAKGGVWIKFTKRDGIPRNKR